MNKEDNSEFLTCGNIDLKIPDVPNCNVQGQVSNSTIISNENNEGLFYGDELTISNENPLFVNSSNAPDKVTAAITYANRLRESSMESTSICGLWDHYIDILGLNGLHQPLLATQNPKLHMLGGWAAGYALSQGIYIRYVVEILASPASAGAALHGIVWSHLVAWLDRKKNNQAASPTTTSAASNETLDDELWAYALKHVCFMADNHPQMYVHCLHAFGHAALVASVFDAHPLARKSISYSCPAYPEIPNNIAVESESNAVRICAHANRYTFLSSSRHRREQEAFICADGVYMLYFEQRIFMAEPKDNDKKSGAGTTINTDNADLHVNWWEPCGVYSRFAAPCFEFLFRTGTAGRRIAGLPPLVPRSRHAAPPSTEEQWAARRILFPTLCLRSETRIKASANPTFISATQQFLACVHAISEHLYESQFPYSGIGFLNRCNTRATENLVKHTVNQRDTPWRAFPGSPLEPIFSFCAQSTLNIGFDKLLTLKQPKIHVDGAVESEHDKQVRIERIQHISRALVAKSTWSDQSLLSWKACVAGIGTSASFFTAVDFIPCWSVKWTLCRDTVPRDNNGKNGHLGTVEKEMVNTCIRLALSRSQRTTNVNVEENLLIWDTKSLGFT
jgi:hypothetical protein